MSVTPFCVCFQSAACVLTFLHVMYLYCRRCNCSGRAALRSCYWMLHGVTRHSTCRLLPPTVPPGFRIPLTAGPGPHTLAPDPIRMPRKWVTGQATARGNSKMQLSTPPTSTTAGPVRLTSTCSLDTHFLIQLSKVFVPNRSAPLSQPRARVPRRAGSHSEAAQAHSALLEVDNRTRARY